MKKKIVANVFIVALVLGMFRSYDVSASGTIYGEVNHKYDNYWGVVSTNYFHTSLRVYLYKDKTETKLLKNNYRAGYYPGRELCTADFYCTNTTEQKALFSNGYYTSK